MLIFFSLTYIVLDVNACLINPINSGIVNGKEVRPCDKYRFQAFFVTDLTRCGGNLITKQTVLTAGHCAIPCEERNRMRCLKYRKQKYVSVYVGGFLRPDVIDASTRQKGPLCNSTGEKVDGEFVHHPGYDPEEGSKVPDIALIRLERKVRTVMWSEIICLPKPHVDFGGRTATVIGWGSLKQVIVGKKNQMFKRSPVLQETKLDVLDEDEDCADFPKYQICAYRPSTDACQGDSGSPLFVTEHGIRIEIGIVSKGKGCADPRYPGIYTKVSSLLYWIRSKMRGREPTHCVRYHSTFLGHKKHNILQR